MRTGQTQKMIRLSTVATSAPAGNGGRPPDLGLAGSQVSRCEADDSPPDFAVFWRAGKKRAQAMNGNPAEAARMQRLLTQFWDAPDFETDHQAVGELLGTLEAWIVADISKRSGAYFATKSSRPQEEGFRLTKTRDEWLAEDAAALALHQVWAALKKMRSGTLPAVADADALRRYTASTARHAWCEVLRQESRQWNSVRKSILAWVEGGDTGYAVWRLSPFQREKLVGPCNQKGQAAPALEGTSLCVAAGIAATALFPGKSPGELNRAEACRAVLAAARQPIPLNELTTAVCTLQGWSESTWSLDEGRDGERPPSEVEDDTAKSPSEQLLDTEKVRAVWRAILQLPLNQRRVLLLDLDVVETFEVYGGVSLSVIAGALDFRPEQLSGLIDRMPLADGAIAELTGLKRQSVRNLRFEAKRGLRRLLSRRVF